MRNAIAVTLCALVLLAVAAARGSADETLVPSWMKADAATKTVSIEFVAGWSANNGALNYNGYYKGDMTVVIPPGWKVDVKFRNHDGMLPHSVLVTKPYLVTQPFVVAKPSPPNQIPEQAGVSEVAIARAYSNEPETGMMADHREEFGFNTRDAGQFWLLCGVTGHALQGMWVKLSVDAQADQPHIAIADGAEPGWR